MLPLLKLAEYVVPLLSVVTVANVADMLARLFMYPPVITTLVLLKFVACTVVALMLPVRLPLKVVATTLPVRLPATLPVNVPVRVVATTFPCTVPCSC